MHKIIAATQIASDVRWLKIDAPLVARACQAGQFVIVRLDDNGERIPLTIAGTDPARGCIDLVIKAIGKTTIALCQLGAGDLIRDVAGPLGKPTEIVAGKHAAVVGGGVGAAVILPIAAALKQASSRVIALTGGHTRDAVLLEIELSRVCDRVIACTDDGSYGFSGTVADCLRDLIAGGDRLDIVYTAGPVPMMRAIAELTRPHAIRTIASLNPIMVDGTGMCGGCRVSVGGQVRFACVDGPEFDAHAVDFGELSERLSAYRSQEQLALRRWNDEHGRLCTRP
ncbi:Dihydroorotate dehydrogenase B (NAD(+)), electron transfer subunit [Phycisphaerae bacterium RAS1]|nr:Dihydroorotate dehydrogenase B (NAD(+)), electron transfer subunit [Phycisphaerae bacterium RAS1]